MGGCGCWTSSTPVSTPQPPKRFEGVSGSPQTPSCSPKSLQRFWKVLPKSSRTPPMLRWHRWHRCHPPGRDMGGDRGEGNVTPPQRGGPLRTLNNGDTQGDNKLSQRGDRWHRSVTPAVTPRLSQETPQAPPYTGWGVTRVPKPQKTLSWGGVTPGVATGSPNNDGRSGGSRGPPECHWGARGGHWGALPELQAGKAEVAPPINRNDARGPRKRPRGPPR